MVDDSGMSTTSQTLTIAGLIFEFISVSLTIRKLFYGYHKRLGELTTFAGEIKREQKEGTLVLIFLIIGMSLQAIAVLT